MPAMKAIIGTAMLAALFCAPAQAQCVTYNGFVQCGGTTATHLGGGQWHVQPTIPAVPQVPQTPWSGTQPMPNAAPQFPSQYRR